jgi:hypothetical protein
LVFLGNSGEVGRNFTVKKVMIVYPDGSKRGPYERNATRVFVYGTKELNSVCVSSIHNLGLTLEAFEEPRREAWLCENKNGTERSVYLVKQALLGDLEGSRQQKHLIELREGEVIVSRETLKAEWETANYYAKSFDDIFPNLCKALGLPE